MPDRMVWVEQETMAGTVRTWHLEGVPGETLCGQKTQSMKPLPKAAWDQVLNPCTRCQLKADQPVAMYGSERELVDNPDVIETEPGIGRHGRRE